MGVAAGVLVVEVTSARRGGLRPCEAGVGHHWGSGTDFLWEMGAMCRECRWHILSEMVPISRGGGCAVEVGGRPGLEVQVLGPPVAAAGTSRRM